MSHLPNPDRPGDPLPARYSEHVPAPLPHDQGDDAHHGAPSGKKVTLRLVARAIRRHWWQAGLIWLVGSAGLMVVAYVKVKPTYWAFSQVRIEQGDRPIFSSVGSETGFDIYKETQVNILTSPTVIEAALTKHPELGRLPRLAASDDKVLEIRKALTVGVVPRTHLIQVEMTSENGLEAALIVNAVVDSYLLSARNFAKGETEERVDRLRKALEVKEAVVKQQRLEIQAQAAKNGNVNVDDAKNHNQISIEEYRALSSQLMPVEIEIAKAEARLAQLQSEASVPAGSPEDVGRVSERELTSLFYNHPKVAGTVARLEEAKQKHATLSDKVRQKDDPSLLRWLREKRAAEKQLDSLWEELKPELLAANRGGVRAGGGPGAGGIDREVRDAELNLSSLNTHRASLQDKMNSLTIRQRAEGADALKLEFARMDLSRAEQYKGTLDTTLQQIEYENKNPLARIRVEFVAKPSPKPSSANRLKLMAIAPIGMMFGVLGLMVLLELHAGRVADPEDLITRVRVPVIGVVPPLPQVRQPNAGLFSPRDEFRAQRQLDQFVQSLDHLRVALCSGRDAWGRERRVILITSACGSEGKTTLAAQLAERCVNAGLHTLLVDGDLRNPTLSRMLDVPGGRGLINVLRGEVSAEEAMSVVGGAGGFHFMPAGSPKVDPSRLLHGERLGKFLQQAREGFDIVIVDAPPVLPVPDALTIGRWTDGAVLAVRFDTSRFPLVEKANRRLASVGVPVIGAVVNGVKVAESTYGSYYPSYAYSNDRDAAAPLDV